MTIEQLKTLLRKYHLTPNKTFGQNFLLDDIVLQDMIDAAELTGDEAVLEVGPGIATLTHYLLRRAQFVLAVEKDKNFLSVLKSVQKSYDNFQFVCEDILSFDFQKALRNYPAYRVVANIPYYITGKIIQLFVRAVHKPRSITLLVQKEVAENIVARPGKLNLLGISVQLYGQPRIIRIVPAQKFYPAPKVDSAIVHIDLSREARYEIPDEKKLFRILRACFAGKRKQIHNTLTNNLGLKKDQVDQILQEAGIAPTARPQQLTIEDWLKITRIIRLPG